MPALATSTSTGPQRSSMVAKADSTCGGVAHVATHGQEACRRRRPGGVLARSDR